MSNMALLGGQVIVDKYEKIFLVHTPHGRPFWGTWIVFKDQYAIQGEFKKKKIIVENS